MAGTGIVSGWTQASVQGRLVEGSTPPTDIWFLALQPAGDDPADAAMQMQPFVTTSAADGGFHFESVAAGVYDLFALSASSKRTAWNQDSTDWRPDRLSPPASGTAGPATFGGPWGQVGSCAYLGRVEASTSCDPHSFDVSLYRPATVHVHVLRGGIPVFRAMLELRRSEPGSTVAAVWGTSERDGWMTITGIFPGEYDALAHVPALPLVTPSRPSQVFHGPADSRRIVLQPADDVSWTVSLSQCTGTLLCLDEKGERPLSGAAIRVWHMESGTWIVDYVLTDDEGRVPLTRPTGELRVGRLSASTASLLQPHVVAGAAAMGPYYDLWSRFAAEVTGETWRGDTAVRWECEGSDAVVRLPGEPP